MLVFRNTQVFKYHLVDWRVAGHRHKVEATMGSDLQPDGFTAGLCQLDKKYP